MFLCRPLFSRWLTVALLLAVEASATAPPTSNLEFVANRGQWPAAVEFAATLPAGQLFVERTAFTFALLTPRPHAASDSAAARPPAGHAYRVHFAGASGGPAPVGEQPISLLRNYLRGPDPAGWVRDAPAFGAVLYPRLYPGIDLRLHDNPRRQLEYTFTVRPGGRPGAIALRYEGTDGLRLDAAGNLLIATSLGRVTELAPRAWQLAPDGQPEPVPCAFVLESTTVHFRFGAYDPARPLIIDPVILFATYTGAPADNWGHTAAPDAQGNLYSAGTIFAAGYPVSPGAFDPGFNGSIDVAIIKYNPSATGPAARVYATYLGGSGVDAPHRLIVNPQGELLILGTTGSANFPVTAGAYSTRFRGGPARTVLNYCIEYRNGVDLFVSRLSADGRSLLGSSYLGGSGTDGFVGNNQPPFGSTLNFPISNSLEFMGDIQLDAVGNVFVAASTGSPDFPVAGAASVAYRGGQSDAVVAQLSPDLGQLRWATCLGGSATDAAFALVPDRQGGVYVAGATGSPNFPFSATAYQSAKRGGPDAFVAHIGSSGQQLAAARLGTPQADVARLLALDAAGNVLVVGQSGGLMPVTPGCYGVPGGNFLQSLSPDLAQLRFAAVFSAAYARANLALGIDECDRIYLATLSSTFNALRFSAGARTLEHTMVLPGKHVHGASRFDGQGRLYLAVCAACDSRENFPLPPGVNFFAPYSATKDICNDASFIADLQPGSSFTAAQQVVCANAAPLILGGSPAGGTWAGPGVGPGPGGGYQFVPGAVSLGTHILAYYPIRWQRLPCRKPGGTGQRTNAHRFSGAGWQSVLLRRSLCQ